jgi:hypothetical protein
VKHLATFIPKSKYPNKRTIHRLVTEVLVDACLEEGGHFQQLPYSCLSSSSQQIKAKQQLVCLLLTGATKAYKYCCSQSYVLLQLLIVRL